MARFLLYLFFSLNLFASTGFVANYGSNSVSIFDIETQTELQQISVGAQPHGTWLSDDGKSLYVANMGSNTVSIINVASRIKHADVVVGEAPVELLSANGFIYSADSQSNTVSIVNEQTLTLVATLNTGNGPEGIERSKNQNYVYVSNSLSQSVSVIDTNSNTVVDTIHIGTDAHNLRLSEDGSKLYVTAPQAHKVVIVDTSSNTVSGEITLDTTSNPVEVLAYNQHIYVTTTGDGTLYKIDAQTDNILNQLQIGVNLHGLMPYADGKLVISHSSANAIALVNTELMQQIGTVDVGFEPRGIVIGDSDGDGIDDIIENQAIDVFIPIPTGDGNGDGILDRTQSYVTSFPIPNTSDVNLTLSNLEETQQSNITTSAVPAGFPAGVTAPYGLLGFDVITSGTSHMSIYIPNYFPLPPGFQWGYWKEDSLGNWYDIATNVSFVGAKVKIDFTLNDNDAFDSNPATGIISDPGVVGFAIVTSIAVKGNNLIIADNDSTPSTTDHTDFESADVSGGTVERIFTIENDWPASVDIDLEQIEGPHASDFTVTVPPAATIPSGGSTTFTVRFTPSAGGLRSANIVHQFSNGSDHNFSIQGTGTVAPEINVKGNAVPIADGDTVPDTADHTDFESVDVSGATVDRVFTIENTGTAPLTITTPLTLSGTHASDFTVSQPAITTIAVGGQTTFTVEFDPSDLGLRSATISIANSDADEDPYDFAIEGTGTAITVPLFSPLGYVLLASLIGFFGLRRLRYS